MIQTHQTNPSIPCGLRPRLRRDLDHAKCEEDSIVFNWLQLSQQLPEAHKELPGRSKGCLDAKNAARCLQEAARTLQRMPGRNNWRRRRCPDAHKRLPGRSRGCLQATLGGLDIQKAFKIATETLRERLGDRLEPQGAPGEA